MSQQPPNQLLTLPGLGGDANDVAAAPLPWWRRPRVIIGIAVALLILIIGGLLLSILNRKAPTTYQTQQVTQGDLSLTINATGPLQTSYYNMVFQGTGGRITEIDVKQGQKVTKGQVLAKLDKTALQDAVNADNASLQSAQLGLNSALANLGAAENNTNANIAAAQTAVGVSQANQGGTNGVSVSNVSAAQTTLNNDQANLNRVRAETNTTVRQAAAQRQQDRLTCSVQATATATSRITPVATKAPATTTTTTTTGTGTTGTGTTGTGTTGTGTTGTGTTGTGTTGTNSTVVPAKKTNAATNSGMASTDSASISYMSSSIDMSASDSTSLDTCYRLADDKYNSTVATANANITTAENLVNTAQQGLTQAQAGANSNNTTASGQVTTNQSSVNTAKSSTAATSAESSVTSAQGNLAIAVANLATAQHNLDNATLTAPHDGTVTTINGTVGGTPGVPVNSATTTSTTGSTFIQLVDLNALQVQANVNESDTGNLKVGQPAVFTVNAYGNRQFNGTVSGISPNGVTVSNVVTYPVNIDVDMNSAKGANLLPNMTANATITVVQRKNVPQISVNAINFARLASSGSTGSTTPQLITRQDANAATLKARQMLGDLENQNPSIASDSPIPAYVIERPGGGDVFTAKPVVLGLTDGTNYEVLEGLSPGETYIVGTGTSTRPGAANSGG